MGSLEAMESRTRQDPYFLGWVLDRYAQAERLTDDAALAAAVGCPLDQLTRLRLCRTPRETPADFRADVHRIAEVFELDPARLAAVIRRVNVLVRLEAADAGSEPAPTLMAARDREEEP